jgi:hypothetical protein
MATSAKAIIVIGWLMMCPHQTLAQSGIWQYQCNMKNQETHVLGFWYVSQGAAQPNRDIVSS